MNIDANVQKIIYALIRKWKLLAIFAVIGCLLGYFYTANFTTLTYSSSVIFLCEAVDPHQEISDNAVVSGDYIRISSTSKLNYTEKMLPTYIEIFKTNTFNTSIAENLNERVNAGCSSGTIKYSSQYKIIEDTNLILVTVTTSSADLSYEIAQQLEKDIPSSMKEINNGLVKASVQDKPLKAGGAESLGYPKKMAIGAIAGIVLASAYVILRNLIDVRIRTEEELTEKYNIPVLGSIPDFEVKGSQGSSLKSKERG